MLRLLTRLVLLFALGFFAPGEAAARVVTCAGLPDLSAAKTRVVGECPELAVLRQAAAMQAAETQWGSASHSYESASIYSLAAENTGTALARQLGQAGEDAVGIDQAAKVSIEIPGSGQIRIPDALTDTTLTEVKNVGSLSYTQQLRDFSTYSQANGLNFELYVRPTTQLSGPLQQAITNGQITLKLIPGP